MGYPVLADRFFEEKRPTREFFERWVGVGPWGPTLLPVYEWNGILYVAACPPFEFQVQENWCVVQANPSHLQALWEEFSAAPASLQNFADATVVVTNSDSAISIPSLNLEDIPQLPSEPSPDSVSLEVKIENTASEVSIPSLEGILENPTPAAATPAPIAPAAAVENFELQDTPAPTPEAEVPVETLDFASEDEKRAGTAPAPASVNLAALFQKPGAAPAASMPEPTPAAAKAPVNLQDEETPVPGFIAEKMAAPAKTVNSAAPGKPAAAKPAPPTAKPAPAAPVAPAAAKPATPAAPKNSPAAAAAMSGSVEDWKNLWTQLNSTFQHSMVLLFRKGQVLPYKWDPQLSAAAPKPLSVQKPSPFRIVAKTQKPYHGYLVPNEVSDEFFKIWNKGQYPEHLTMSPIVIGELVAGFVMAWGEASANTKEALQLVDHSAESLGQAFMKKPELLKAA